jgi:NADPH:quinone reductase-like Zn-dependent oxidoreductase
MKSKRIVIFKTGGIDSMRLEEGEIPEPGSNQIRIRVKAAGVAYADVMMRHGRYPGAPAMPFAPGYDVTGVVDAIGENVCDFKMGSMVTALTQFGGYAQHVCVEPFRTVSLPSNTNPYESVCLPLNYITGYQMLHNVAKVSQNDKILIHSAAGGVGTAVLQLGTLHNLQMYGTASKGKHSIVTENNGIPIDYKNDDFTAVLKKMEPAGIDAVFDPIGGENWFRSREVLKKGGKLIGFGALSVIDRDRPIAGLAGIIGSALKLKIFNKGRPFYFYGINFKKDPAGFHRDFSQVISLYTSGKLKPIVHKVLPLEKAGEAHHMLTSGEATGKLVLDCF